MGFCAGSAGSAEIVFWFLFAAGAVALFVWIFSGMPIGFENTQKKQIGFENTQKKKIGFENTQKKQIKVGREEHPDCMKCKLAKIETKITPGG